MGRFCAALLALSCAIAAASTASAQSKTTAAEVINAFKACLSAIDGNPRYARVYTKLGVSTATDLLRDPSQVQLADTERVSDSDIAAVLSWIGERQHCVLPAMQASLKIAPEAQIVYTNNLSRVTAWVNEIATAKPSFGYVNQKLLAIHIRGREEWNQVEQKIRDRLSAEQGFQERQEDLEDYEGELLMRLW